MTERLRRPSVHRALLAGGVVGVLTVASLATAVPASAAVPVVRDSGAAVVTADALPTAQIDGVAWAQAIAGNTVYVGGEFTTARPAGAAEGQQTEKRGNLMAYTLSTGEMTSFAPIMDKQVRAVAVSPDGKRVYVGGEFTKVTTTVGGSTTTTNRYRIAAFDTATGALVTTFAPVVNYIVKAIVATNTTVYLGGQFATVGGLARNRLAAVRASDGKVLPWAPSADAQVNALALSPVNDRMYVGGSFQNVNGQPAYGLAAVSSGTGALKSFPASVKVRNAGSGSAILSLVADDKAVYGTGYQFGGGGNLEGTFSANVRTGALNWIEDCHGDTYGVYASAAAVYVASHSHYCGNIGGFPETNPRSYHHALAFSRGATGTIGKEPTTAYFNWEGENAPSMLAWYPDLAAGSYTGVTQAAWSVTGNAKYVVYGGEFPSVNGVAQQGLVRFAVPAVAPNAVGPQIVAGRFTPTLTSPASGTVKISWTANWDEDSLPLTYRVYRDGASGAPIYTTSAKSTFWSLPAMEFVDTGLTPGSTHGYRVFATDADGNAVRGNTVEITVS